MENNYQNAPTTFMVRKAQVHTACVDWIVDSGATDHLTGDDGWFGNDLEQHEPGELQTASGSLRIEGRGDLHIWTRSMQIVLKNVLYVLGLGYNLFSVPRAMAAVARVVFQDCQCLIEKDNIKLQATPQNDGTLALQASAEKWHARLGHTSVYVLKEIGSHGK